MLQKSFEALLTVLAGVGAALVLFWLLNKVAELLPEKWENRLKPLFYILPAYASIVPSSPFRCWISQTPSRGSE